MKPLFKLTKPQNADVCDTAFKVYANSESAELLVMEEIGQDFFGDGIAATDVVNFLADHKEREINVRLNSPGGFVYDGMVMYNALASHKPKVTVTVEGLAFSAASLVAMAGDHVRMHEVSDFGIHRAWGASMGNSKVMRGVAEWLDTIDSHLIDVYSSRSGQNRDQVEEWLDGTDDGTVFSAQEAVAAGFADEVIPIPAKSVAKDYKRQHEMLQAQLKAKHAKYRHQHGRSR